MDRLVQKIEASCFFSIITIVLNGVSTLEKTINSVLGQSFDQFEYILIDGGSTDGTLDIIQKYRDRLSYWVSERDAGVSDAFNKGIKKAGGQYVVFVNADDTLTKDALHHMHVYLSRYPDTDILCGAVEFFDGDRFIAKVNSYPNRIRKESSIHHASSAIKLDTLHRSGYFDPDYMWAMDYELFIRLHQDKAIIVSTSATLSNRDINGLTQIHAFDALKEVRSIQSKYINPFYAAKNYYFYALKLGIGRILRKYIPFLYRWYHHLQQAQ